MLLLEKLLQYIPVVERQIETVPDCLQVVPFSRRCVAGCLDFGPGIDLHSVSDGDYVLSRVSFGLACHGDQLRIDTLDAALFLKLAQACNSRALPVADEAPGERVAPFEWLAASCDQENIYTVIRLTLFCHNAVYCEVRHFVNFLVRGLMQDQLVEHLLGNSLMHRWLAIRWCHER